MTAPDLTKTAPWSTDTHDLLTRSMGQVMQAQAVLGTKTRKNLITNPSFETGLTGWTLYGSGTVLSQITGAGVNVAGAYALRCTVTANTNNGAYFQLPAVVGQRYAALATSRLNGTEQMGIRLLFVDGAGGTVLITSGPTIQPGAAVWAQSVVEETCPVGAVNVRVIVNRRVAGPAGQFLDVDAVACYALTAEETFSPTYFDGDTADTALVDYRWDGTPHASTSTETSPGTFLGLDVQDGSVGWDETRAPRVTARLVCKVPPDQATLDSLDPRTGVRIVVDAGYRRPDGTTDLQPLANLALRSRDVSRPSNQMTLTAASDESLVIDRSPTTPGPVNAASTTAAITTVIREVLPNVTPTVTGPTGPAITAVQYSDRWDVINDLADRIAAQVFDNGLRAWFIQPMPVVVPASPALVLKVGEGGTIIGSDTGLTRDEGFANQVLLVYKWTTSGGVDNTIIGSRKINSGPYASTAANTKVLMLDREVATTQTEADAAAAALVKRTVTRGRSFSLDTINAFWLRPGHTIEVTLPLGPAEQHVVTAVEFDLVAGRMHVVTRLPDGDYTIGA